MIDDQTVDVQSTIVGIGFGVLQQLQKEFRRFLGPATHRRLPDLGLCTATNAAVETPEWHTFLAFGDIFEESLGTTQWHSLDGQGGFASVLEVHSNVAAA